MTRPALHREVERRLREHGIRYTAGRETVVAALANGAGPRSAAELHEQTAGSIPVSSLYRSLGVLEEAGVVVPHFGAKGLTRFELAEWFTGHHHHLVCTDCGSVDDIEIGEVQEREVQALVDEIGAQAQFHVTDHVLEIEGRCVRCR